MSEQTRRGMLKTLTALGSAVVAGVLAVPGAGYVLDPLLRRRKGEGEYRTVAAIAQLSDDAPTSFSFIGELRDAWMRARNRQLGTVWLQKRGDQVLAHSAECPHLGCKIRWNQGEGRFFCPCHDSSFDRDGKVLSGPSPRDMDTLEARVREGLVEIRFKRYRTNTRDRNEVG